MLAEGAVLLRQESLERLCVDYIDIIQCHDIEFGSLQQLVEETLPGAQAARCFGLHKGN
jgi:aryl-alcohol dehydrogenase-like predicted oxidoreductase